MQTFENEIKKENFIKVTDVDGFQVHIAEQSTKLIGSAPKKGDTITVHYTGMFEDSGRVFDSSRERNRPFSFQIGTNQVIKCWEEGFSLLTKFQRAQFRCPPEYAYGS